MAVEVVPAIPGGQGAHRSRHVGGIRRHVAAGPHGIAIAAVLLLPREHHRSPRRLDRCVGSVGDGIAAAVDVQLPARADQPPGIRGDVAGIPGDVQVAARRIRHDPGLGEVKPPAPLPVTADREAAETGASATARTAAETRNATPRRRVRSCRISPLRTCCQLISQSPLSGRAVNPSARADTHLSPTRNAPRATRGRAP